MNEEEIKKCGTIVILSALLGTATETSTSTIIPIQECLRRLNKLKPGSYLSGRLNEKIAIKMEGDPSTAIQFFGKPPMTKNIQQDVSDQSLEEFGEPIRVDRSKSSENEHAKIRWSPEFMLKIKSFAADFEPLTSSHQHQSVQCPSTSTVPVRTFKKRSKTILKKSPPLPFLGRSFKKVDRPTSRPADISAILETFRKNKQKNVTPDADKENHCILHNNVLSKQNLGEEVKLKNL